MGNVNLVKSVLTGGVATALAEVAAADTAVLPGGLAVGSLAGFLFGTAGVMSGVLATARFKVLTSTWDIATATGTLAMTGTGFIPGAVILIMGVDSSTSHSNCLGFDDGTNRMSVHYTTQVGQAGVLINTTISFRIYQTDLTKGMYGYVQSFDANGLTLTITRSSTPSSATVTIIALCFR
jgi:hypothetical protein